MATDKVRPIIGVPMERVLAYADEAFWAFIAIAQQGWPFIRLPYGRTDVARNKFALHVLKEPQFTHLVMLDADHAHPADIVKRLAARVVEDPGRLVIGGLNFRRGKPYEPCAFVERDGLAFSIGDWTPGELVKVDRLGTGSVIIAREVFERLPGPPWFWNDYGRAAEDVWPGEDMTFSRLCQQHGIDLWLDTSITSDHLIDGRINEAVYRAYVAEHREDFEEREV